jgi:hypothetical protein
VSGHAGAQSVGECQGHREHLGAQALVEPGVEGDAHAAGDERGGVVIQQRAVVVGGVDDGDPELRRGVLQTGERSGPGHGHLRSGPRWGLAYLLAVRSSASWVQGFEDGDRRGLAQVIAGESL